MTRLAALHGAINLAQGYPDFSCPPELKEAASKAIFDDYNQYSVTWGAQELRSAIADKAMRYNRIPADPQRNIVVTCGTTEAMVAAQIALLDPGDELIVFSPHYENYAPDAVISGASPKYFELTQPFVEGAKGGGAANDSGFTIDEERLKAQFTSRTRGIVLNTPMNPSGKVFTLDELRLISDLCNDYDAVCFTDEIYEYITYDGALHVSMASLESMRDRTVTISGFSKTFSVTGWRVGYTIANEQMTSAIKKVHDFLTVGAPHPLQIACAKALSLSEKYYDELRREYTAKRNILLSSLKRLGFRCARPQGAYYIWSDFSEIDNHADDRAFANYLVTKVGVAGVPGSSFFSEDSAAGKKKIRFTFSKKVETLEAACRKLENLGK